MLLQGLDDIIDIRILLEKFDCFYQVDVGF